MPPVGKTLSQLRVERPVGAFTGAELMEVTQADQTRVATVDEFKAWLLALAHSLDALSDVNTAGANVGEALVYDGAGWVPGLALPSAHTHSQGDITGLVAALGLKLDATSYTATDVLAKLLTVDGTGTSLDADLLDGLHATAFAPVIHAHDASAIATGTIDPARLPVLPSTVQIVSSGGIAALTAPQQAEIGDGSVVTTTDGRRWVYAGSGSKTAEASYIELADITPEWAVVANKPTTLAGYGITDGALQADLLGKVAKTGDIMSGPLSFAGLSGNNQIQLGAGGRVYDVNNVGTIHLAENNRIIIYKEDGSAAIFDADFGYTRPQFKGVDLALYSDVSASLDVLSHTYLATGTGAVARSLHSWLVERAISVKDFDAKLDGTTPDDTAFTNALARAKVTGQAVYIPSSTNGMRLTSPKYLDYPGTIFGDGRPGIAGATIQNGASYPRAKGSWIFVDHTIWGANSHCLRVQNAGQYVLGATIRDLGFYYPQPTPTDSGAGTAPPTVPYVPLEADYCIYAEGQITLTVQDVNFHNPTNALYYANTGIGHLNIKGVRGGPLTRGIYIDNIYDTCCIHDVRWWQDQGAGHDLLYHMLNNKVGLTFGHVDGPMVSQYFDIMSYACVRFVVSATAPSLPTTRAKFSNIYLDVAVRPIEIMAGVTNTTADFTNLTLAGHAPPGGATPWFPGGEYGLVDFGTNTHINIVNLDTTSIGYSAVSQQGTGGIISIHNFRTESFAQRGSYGAVYCGAGNTLYLTGRWNNLSAGTLLAGTGSIFDLTNLNISAFGKTLLDDPDAATARATLGAYGAGSNGAFAALTATESISSINGSNTALQFGDRTDWSAGATWTWYSTGYQARLYNGTYGEMLTVANGYIGLPRRLEVASAENAAGMLRTVSHASYTSLVDLQSVSKAAANDFHFAAWYSGGFADCEFRVDGTGAVFADNAFSGAGADYAEMFEWADGNKKGEDRVGLSVVLEGAKIRKASEKDKPESILGLVSGAPVVLGDAAWDRWSEKYLRDDFGRYLQEEYLILEWTEEVVVESEGENPAIVRDELRSYPYDAIPEGVVVPKKGVKKSTSFRRVLNPDYDPNATYVPRAERKEWSAIGLMGKLRLRKGQPVGARWIKLRDISPTVEEWLVR